MATYFTFLNVFWTLTTVIISGGGYYVLFKPRCLPDLFIAAFLYGKVAATNSKTTLLKSISVPKRWFTHFYQASVIVFGYNVLCLFGMYFLGHSPCRAMVAVLDLISPGREITVTATTAMIVQILEFCQVLRRCYECMYVSIYSDVRMHVWHYLMGYGFYFGVQMTILSLSPGMTLSDAIRPSFSFTQITWNHIIGAILFIWAFSVQYDTHVRMANFRKDKSGKIVSKKHEIPKGGWFELVSCPHYFSEIMVYVALTLIVGTPNLAWWLMMAWTVSNQVVVALMSHYWYLETFPKYPTRRKAIFPFIL